MWKTQSSVAIISQNTNIRVKQYGVGGGKWRQDEERNNHGEHQTGDIGHSAGRWLSKSSVSSKMRFNRKAELSVT